MGLTERLNRAALSYLRPRRSSAYPYAMDDYLSWMATAGASFPMYGLGRGSLAQAREEAPDGSYESLVLGAYRRNGVVFAVEMARLFLFKEARFSYQRMRDGEPGELFGSQDLSILEHPWPGGTTGVLLTKMLYHADMAGTAIVARRASAPDRLDVLRPDWTILVGSDQYSESLLGAAYFPGGITSGADPELLMRDEIAVFAPVPDGLSRFRGMPWLTPIINEILVDNSMTQHKLDFFRNGATVNQVVSLDPGITLEMFDKWVDKFEQAHANRYGQAFKTLYLGAGAKFDKVGSTPAEIDLRAMQGALETRISAAGLVPPIIVGLSEGLASATYSNYGMARRRYADLTMRPLWHDAADALSAIVPVPDDARLWYNDKAIPFLQEDAEDAARIDQIRANTIRTLWDGGAEPQSVIETIAPQWSKTLKHTGKLSVQLQEPGTEPTDPARALAGMLAPYLSPPSQPPALPAKAEAVERGRRELMERGIVRPTNEQVAEHMGISVRTLYDWKREAA